MGPAEAAAELLAREGIEAAVINARFVKPLDRELICDLARDCGQVVTVEENCVAGGFGSTVGELLHQQGVRVPLLSLGLPDEFIEHGSREVLLAGLGLEAEGIARRTAEFVRSRARTRA